MYQWTSEAVSQGHPDKVADQISDAILDAFLSKDRNLHVACECMVMKDLIVISGEVSPCEKIDVEAVVRRVLRRIGYDRPEHSYDGNTVQILDKLNVQSQEIATAVERKDGQIGAGDQGIMFGFACNETKTLMPLTHHLAFRFINALEHDISLHRDGDKWGSIFLPDAKSQVTIQYNDDDKPEAVKTVVISTQHRHDVSLSEVQDYIHSNVIPPLTKEFEGLFNSRTKFLINPAGAWHFGGPGADTGLTGRKIVIDNYGADCPIGGGAFSGKDPTKVDRSAAYAARYLAKNIVHAALAERATIQLSYAIGIPEPVSVRVMTPDKTYDRILSEVVREIVDLSPRGIIEHFDLLRPIYEATASGGHFGREFPWEKCDLAQHLVEIGGRA